jgi:hypothetical protein
MATTRHNVVNPGNLELAVFLLALLWYCSFAVLLYSGKNGLDEISWPWLLILAFSPAFTAALVVAMHLSLRNCRRPLGVHEMILMVFIAPQFLGAVYVWLGLCHYMGVL